MPDGWYGLEMREGLSPLTGEALVLVNCNEPPETAPQGAMAVVVGTDAAGHLPELDPEHFDVLLTAHPDPPAPWMSAGSRLARIEASLASSPIAAVTLARLMRLQPRLDFAAALECESLAYSTLLGGEEFTRWLGTRRPPQNAQACATPVAADFDGDTFRITLSDPDNRNAMSASMRDALYNALAIALDHPDAPVVSIDGAGPCLSTGGHLPEFGTASDLAFAHLVRVQRSNTALLHMLGDRAQVLFHGACIGSGLEIFAGASRRFAASTAWFQLPELRMGLIPGAGGTVTLARAIGRQRALCLILTAERFRARDALAWGLVEQVLP